MTMTFIWYESLFYVTSGLTDMTSWNFQLRISILFFFGLSHNLIGEIWDIHVTLQLYKISRDLEGLIDILDQL